jgi:hypothetical protein
MAGGVREEDPPWAVSVFYMQGREARRTEEGR